LVLAGRLSAGYHSVFVGEAVRAGHDFEFHMFSWMEVLGNGRMASHIPRAALAHWGYGEARFLFYPPAS